jgi:hypothetical protein
MYKKLMFIVLLFILGLSFYMLVPAEGKGSSSKEVDNQNKAILDNQALILQKLDEIKKELEKIRKRVR